MRPRETAFIHSFSVPDMSHVHTQDPYCQVVIMILTEIHFRGGTGFLTVAWPCVVPNPHWLFVSTVEKQRNSSWISIPDVLRLGGTSQEHLWVLRATLCKPELQR